MLCFRIYNCSYMWLFYKLFLLLTVPYMKDPYTINSINKHRNLLLTVRKIYKDDVRRDCKEY